MHELSLCENLLELIRAQQQQRGFRQVRRVVLELGALGHVEPEALEFAFQIAAKDSPADSAILELREIPGVGRCLDCEREVTVARRGNPCPLCGSFAMVLQQGDELRLKELEVV